MKQLLACPAPAKLNLFLHVTGRRADGYHLIETCFVLIDIEDRLDFIARDDGEVVRESIRWQHARGASATLSAAEIPASDDLCVRAARLLKEFTGTQKGVTIRLVKETPTGGGLGGGSSDAATTLIALNRLWGLHLPRAELMRLGTQLGADVPFFVFGQNAFGRGIGEELSAIDFPPQDFCVVHPGIGVPTAAIFGAPELTRDTDSLKITDFSASAHALKNRPPKWSFGPDFGRNDLEPVAVARYPEVGAALEWLRQIGPARMSGSGACVYCPTQSREIAQEALRELPSRWSGWVSRSLTEHPLLSWTDG